MEPNNIRYIQSVPSKSGRAAPRSGVPLSATGEIDRVLSELDPANQAAIDAELVEKVLMRSREVKFRNFRCFRSYGMPEEPQLFLGDRNVLAARYAEQEKLSNH